MNKLFSKLWKSRGLSLFLALAMVLTMLPGNSLLAGATGNGSDPNSGIATVSAGETVAMLYTSDETRLDDAETRFLSALQYADEPPEMRPHIIGVMRGEVPS